MRGISQYVKLTGSLEVRYGVHDSGTPMVVLEIVDQGTGAVTMVGLDGAHCVELNARMIRALEMAATEIAARRNPAVVS